MKPGTNIKLYEYISTGSPMPQIKIHEIYK